MKETTHLHDFGFNRSYILSTRISFDEAQKPSQGPFKQNTALLTAKGDAQQTIK
jgi:hypothetical protein